MHLSHLSKLLLWLLGPAHLGRRSTPAKPPKPQVAHPPRLLRCYRHRPPRARGTLEYLFYRKVSPRLTTKRNALLQHPSPFLFHGSFCHCGRQTLTKRGNTDTHGATHIRTLTGDGPRSPPEAHTAAASLPGGVPGQGPRPGACPREPQGTSLPSSATSFSFYCISL